MKSMLAILASCLLFACTVETDEGTQADSPDLTSEQTTDSQASDSDDTPGDATEIATDKNDAQPAPEPVEVFLELGAELGGGDVVDVAGESLTIQHRHPPAAGAEMGMVIRSVEQVADAVLL